VFPLLIRTRTNSATHVKSASIAGVEGRRAFSLINFPMFYRDHGNASQSIYRLYHPECLSRRFSKRRRPALSQTAPCAHRRMIAAVLQLRMEKLCVCAHTGALSSTMRREILRRAAALVHFPRGSLSLSFSLPPSMTDRGYRVGLHRASSNLRVRFITPRAKRVMTRVHHFRHAAVELSNISMQIRESALFLDMFLLRGVRFVMPDLKS